MPSATDGFRCPAQRHQVVRLHQFQAFRHRDALTCYCFVKDVLHQVTVNRESLSDSGAS